MTFFSLLLVWRHQEECRNEWFLGEVKVSTLDSAANGNKSSHGEFLCTLQLRLAPRTEGRGGEEYSEGE